MRVLAVNKFYYLRGGSERYFFELNSALEGVGAEVVPFSMKSPANFPSGYESYFVDNVDYEHAAALKKLHYSFKALYSLEARRKIGELIKASNPDIAHLHVFQHQISPSVLKELKRRGIPVVNTVHDLKPLCPNYKMLCGDGVCEKCKRRRYFRCTLNRCIKDSFCASLAGTMEMYLHWLLGSYGRIDTFITPSSFFRKKFIEYGYPEEKVVYIPNFVDTDAYTAGCEYGDYFIYAGRLSGEKGILTLLEAMKRVKRSYLYIAGDGPLKERIQLEIQAGNMRNVKLMGYLSGKELLELERNCSFAVLPSEWYENCPMSVLEVMAVGRPVIASDMGGLPELVEHGRNGMLFKSGSAGELAGAVNYLLDNPQEVRRMGSEAKKKVEEQYNRKLHLERITNVYNNLFERYGRPLWKV